VNTSSQYDAIAAEYSRTKASPLREHVEAFSLMRMLGDLRALSVLDLACGDGFYTRAIKQAGAAHVVGVDVSEEMIALACQAESACSLGIDYYTADVAHMEKLGEFDLVSAAYLLHYASSEKDLRAMCANIAAQLKPGGRLISINENPAQAIEHYAGYTRYGFNKKASHPLSNESLITYMMVSGTKLIKFDAYYYSAEVYEAALTAAGFTDIVWRPLELAPTLPEGVEPEYFEAYLANPPVIGLECRL